MFGTTYTYDQFEVKNMNQRENVPVIGNVRGQANTFDVIEDFIHYPPTNPVSISEEQR